MKVTYLLLLFFTQFFFLIRNALLSQGDKQKNKIIISTNLKEIWLDKKKYKYSHKIMSDLNNLFKVL